MKIAWLHIIGLITIALASPTAARQAAAPKAPPLMIEKQGSFFRRSIPGFVQAPGSTSRLYEDLKQRFELGAIKDVE